MNNYEFWEKYNKFIKGEIGRLCRKKKELYIDLHIHSNYSADGKQNLKQILETTKEKGFDIIAITDHDSLNVYDELYDIVSKGVTSPIIIPGIEFTTDKREYGNQCHMLQLFVNPKDPVILKDVSKNYNSMFNRSKIQFNRLKENITIKEIIKKHNIHIASGMEWRDDDMDLADMIKKADAKMYQDKERFYKTFPNGRESATLYQRAVE